jgi:hypothetical protein
MAGVTSRFVSVDWDDKRKQRDYGDLRLAVVNRDGKLSLAGTVTKVAHVPMVVPEGDVILDHGLVAVPAVLPSINPRRDTEPAVLTVVNGWPERTEEPDFTLKLRDWRKHGLEQELVALVPGSFNPKDGTFVESRLGECAAWPKACQVRLVEEDKETYFGYVLQTEADRVTKKVTGYLGKGRTGYTLVVIIDAKKA